MNILGISAYYHDSAACIIQDGKILAAQQEERITRKKHDSDFPVNSINYCLHSQNIHPNELDYIVFYDKPFLKFERILETYLAFAPKGFKSFSKSLPLWIKDKLFQKTNIINSLKKLWGDNVVTELSKKLLFSEHHLSHAASAFYPSPFKDAAILTMDGVGEWTTTSLAIGKDKNIEVIKEIHFPHSIGLLYSAITYFTGFKVNSGEYKVMGLAPYGQPKYVNLIKDHLIDIKDDGSFFLNMNYFDYCTGLKMTSDKFIKLFNRPPRVSETKISQFEMDLAASIQSVTEEVVIKLAKNIAETTKEDNLCLAGGVALNCVANGKLNKEKIFKNIWVQPASGDAGGAIGAALCVYHMALNNERKIQDGIDSMKGSFLGPSYTNKQIKDELDELNAVYEELETNKLIEKTAIALSEGKAIGWHQGRMEFGPRALGGRSILADPRSPDIQKQLNLKIKYRESFRPFAPSILSEKVSDWFEFDDESQYMLMVAKIKKDKQLKMTLNEEGLFGIEKLNVPRSTIPAVTHVDYSARIQTVHYDTNPRYYKLLEKFYDLTGCPVLVNTSFNVRGEPIVCSPKDAFLCFMGTEMDILSIGNFILFKDKQNKELKVNYKDRYELD